MGFSHPDFSRQTLLPHLNNRLLARLDASTFAAIEPHLVVSHFPSGEVLAETHGTIQKVYFPHDSIISCVVELVGGGAIETGMIGNDGEFGAGAALDHGVSPNYVTMQVPGTVSVLDAGRFRELAQEFPRLRQAMIQYEQFFIAHVQQTAACNAVHNVQSRTCKWLLRMQKLVGDEIPLTQEFLAQMMGVQRTSVTLVARELQEAGMITYSRGRIHILDLPKVQRSACECDAAINSHYDRIFNV